MRTSLRAVVAALLALSAAPVRADSITLTFDSLAALDGQVIHAYNDQGIQVQASLGWTVIGPSSPYYTGAVGLAPIGDVWTVFDATGTPLAPADSGPLAPSQVAVWVAAAGSDAYAVTIAGFSGTPPIAVWQQDLAGSLTTTPAPIYGGASGPLADLVSIASSSLYQFTELDLNTGLVGGTNPGDLNSGGDGGDGGGGATPEPASAVLLALGLLAIVGVRIRRPA